MEIELTLFYCHTGNSELDSPEAGSMEPGSPSSPGSEFTGMESVSDSTECGSPGSESSEFASTEYESTGVEIVVSRRVEDIPLRQQWPMDDDRLLATLYGSRCVLTDELVPRNSFTVMKTHPVLVSLANYPDLRAQR